jgi:hypothetical protein
MTPLDKTLRRRLQIKHREYVVTLTPDSLKITEKGRRIGLELRWLDLVSGETALAVALHASIGKFQTAEPLPAPTDSKKKMPQPPNASPVRKLVAKSKRARAGKRLSTRN